MLDNLFNPGKIGNVVINNRIVRSATFMRKAEKYGQVGQAHIDCYKELAEGGVGLIITGFVSVDPGGTGAPNQACIYDDSFIPGHKKLTKEIHDCSGAKIAAQLGHTGFQGYHPKYHPIAPSAVFCKITGLTPKEMSIDEISQVSQCFIDAGRRAYDCGYDMVQMHAAHGYMLCNFISPYTNKRTDEYGGSIENRTRIFIDIYNGLKDEVGRDFPIIIKQQTQDFLEDGLMLDEGVKIAEVISKVGYEAIEPSGGSGEAFDSANISYPSLVVRKPEDENYFLPTVQKIKSISHNSKLILMGGIRNPLSADKLLEDDAVDFISMSRPLIREPNLPNRWKSGDITPVKCVSCNSCYMSMSSGPTYCVVERRLEKKRLRKEKKLNHKN